MPADPVSGVPLNPYQRDDAIEGGLNDAWSEGFAAAIAATTTELRAMSDEWLTVEAADYIERLVPLWRDER